MFYENLNNAQNGSIIGPIYSKIGFYILKVNDIRSSSSDTLIIVDEFYARHIMLRSTSVLIKDEKACVILMDIAQQINSGHTSFSDAAKQLSEDQYSALHGGDLCWTEENNFFDTALLEALIYLNKGEIGTPVHSSYGWHLIQLIDKRKIERTEEENKKNYYSMLFKRKFAEAAITCIKEQRTSTYVKIFKKYNYDESAKNKQYNS